MKHNFENFDRVRIAKLTHLVGMVTGPCWQTACAEFDETLDRVYYPTHGTAQIVTCLRCIAEEPKWRGGLPTISNAAIKPGAPSWILALPRTR